MASPRHHEQNKLTCRKQQKYNKTNSKTMRSKNKLKHVTNSKEISNIIRKRNNVGISSNLPLFEGLLDRLGLSKVVLEKVKFLIANKTLFTSQFKNENVFLKNTYTSDVHSSKTGICWVVGESAATQKVRHGLAGLFQYAH